ncbi:hypothetical protein MXB_3579 [Myxobolus squamalis]|nr:hypothetical protein MXB_3579 [Myxobolus squamalis]
MKYKGSSIICTNVPAFCALETLFKMINTGMDMANHHSIALALDTKGPKIQIGLNKNGARVTLHTSNKIVLTTDDYYKDKCTNKILYIDYQSFPKHVRVGQIILIVDCAVVLIVKNVRRNQINCQVVNGARFSCQKMTCLPVVKIYLSFYLKQA